MFEEGRNDTAEDRVLLRVPRETRRECTNDTLVVRTKNEVGVVMTSGDERQERQLDGHHFGPADIATVRLPVGGELPG